ncbi:aspartate/glutamate racemase family protein [uncultured Roseobacter sp.]|uniref:maleate cis-trans isomerase family protein n=1 Tax=uncultured Roseobacter sp. TaxID=114847 RepID=UPI0026180178|nr:aspartate/glutamate racemase family protein [uncultured Roseobacter sp.]
MENFPYQLTGPIGTGATLGLVVLQTDETVEQDFRRLFRADDTALYVTRIPSGADVTPDTLRAMQKALPEATRLLPAAAEFDCVSYCCTSGATLIGPDNVARIVRENASVRAVTDPLTASRAACKAVGAEKLAIVSPYIAAVAAPISDAFSEAGFKVTGALSFGEEIEARVARIDPASIHTAALSAGESSDCDAVFLSCTNLRTLDIIDDLEERLGKPVISSNQALAWHTAGLAGGTALDHPPGRLFRHPGSGS